MTGIEGTEPPSDASSTAPPGPARRRRVPLPASRGGLAGLAVIVIVGAFLAVQFGRQIHANWEIGQQARAIEAEIARIEAQNEELGRELAYLRSDAYVGAEARRLENLGQDGEEILIIPEGAEQPLPEELTAVEPPKPTLQQWVELFFGARAES